MNRLHNRQLDSDVPAPLRAESIFELGLEPLSTEFSLEALLDRQSYHQGVADMTNMPRPEEIQAAPVENIPTYAAEDLVKAEGKANILLNGNTYILRITRAGKLILTK